MPTHWHATCIEEIRPQANYGESKMASKGDRELIKPNGDARYVRRDENGQFSESDDVGRSQKADRAKKAKTTAKPGQGDRGDQKK